jgi:hypothetical protein
MPSVSKSAPVLIRRLTGPTLFKHFFYGFTPPIMLAAFIWGGLCLYAPDKCAVWINGTTITPPYLSALASVFALGPAAVLAATLICWTMVFAGLWIFSKLKPITVQVRTRGNLSIEQLGAQNYIRRRRIDQLSADGMCVGSWLNLLSVGWSVSWFVVLVMQSIILSLGYSVEVLCAEFPSGLKGVWRLLCQWPVWVVASIGVSWLLMVFGRVLSFRRGPRIIRFYSNQTGFSPKRVLSAGGWLRLLNMPRYDPEWKALMLSIGTLLVMIVVVSTVLPRVRNKGAPAGQVGRIAGLPSATGQFALDEIIKRQVEGTQRALDAIRASDSNMVAKAGLESLYASAIASYRQLADQARLKSDTQTVQTTELIIHELESQRFLAASAKVMFPSVWHSENWLKVEEWVKDYGLVLPESVSGSPGEPGGAQPLNEQAWVQVKSAKINSGRWAGAYRYGENQIALPGLKCFNLIVADVQTTKQQDAVRILPIDRSGLPDNVKQELLLPVGLGWFKNSFLATIAGYKQVGDQARLKSDAETVQTADLVVSELETLRALALVEKVMFKGDEVSVMGVKSVEYLENWLKDYGLVLPETGWEPGATLGAEPLSQESWGQVKSARISSGRWAGAYRYGESRIALPGLKCFDIVVVDARNTTSENEIRIQQHVHPKDGAIMVLIQGGPSVVGNPPLGSKTISFWMDKFEVSNEQYARFVAQTGHQPPAHWGGQTPPKTIANHPVVNVSWNDAKAYADWAGKRLPTVAEWEKAAKGDDPLRIYPWGGRHLEPEQLSQYAQVGKGTSPVGSHPKGASPYGVEDMIGNADEWTATPLGSGFPAMITRGGGWNSVGVMGNPLAISPTGELATDPQVKRDDLGFRCVIDAEKQQ